MDGERTGAGGRARDVDGDRLSSERFACLCRCRVSRSSVVGSEGVEGEGDADMTGIGASGGRSRRETCCGIGCAVGKGEGTGVGCWLVLAADSPVSDDTKT